MAKTVGVYINADDIKKSNLCIILNNYECSNIVGKGLVKKFVGYKKVRKWGFLTVYGYYFQPKAQAG